jgi:hypothetical protein
VGATSFFRMISASYPRCFVRGGSSRLRLTAGNLHCLKIDSQGWPRSIIVFRRGRSPTDRTLICCLLSYKLCETPALRCGSENSSAMINWPAFYPENKNKNRGIAVSGATGDGLCRIAARWVTESEARGHSTTETHGTRVRHNDFFTHLESRV